MTLLQCAAGKGRREVVEFLLDQSAQINADSQKGTVLLLAAQSGHREVVELC